MHYFSALKKQLPAQNNSFQHNQQMEHGCTNVLGEMGKRSVKIKHCTMHLNGLIKVKMSPSTQVINGSLKFTTCDSIILQQMHTRCQVQK